MLVAITGGTGFIGKKLVLRHLALGDEVRVLSRRMPGESGLPDAVVWYHGDLNSTENLLSFVEGVDVLYHCAGEIRDTTCMEAVHVAGTCKLIAAATGRVGRWVQLSSVGAYGKRREGVVTEKTVLQPHGVYEATKAKSDAMVEAAALSGAFHQVILRPSNVYGAEMTNQSLFGLISMIQRGLFFYIGKPGASANYIHVDNVVEALVRCGTAPHIAGPVYNLSDHCSVEAFVALIAKALGRGNPRLRLPEAAVRWVLRLIGQGSAFPLTEARVNALTSRTIYCCSKIERELGYKHIVSMEDGVMDLVEFWKRKQALCRS